MQCSDYFLNISKEYQLRVCYILVLCYRIFFSIPLKKFCCFSPNCHPSSLLLLMLNFVLLHIYLLTACVSLKKKKTGSILITLGNTFFKQPTYFPAAFLSLLIFQLFFPVILNRVRCRSVMNYLKGI